MTVRHAAGAYEVRLLPLSALFNDLPPSTFVITDTNVRQAISHHVPELPILELAPGEASKTLATYGECLNWLVEKGASRKSIVLAVGGGVIGDLAGFVAATYMRGIRFIQIPTTLLAQVDSSVGGKVGVDLPTAKNCVGAFHSPIEIRLCPELLAALPIRQFINGMAEVWKYGAIMDRALFEQLSSETLTSTHPALAAIVHRCIELKKQVVEEDEFETTGLRAILNFGHTVAHALEILTGFGPLLHGEAVAIGMVTEARIGERLGITPTGTAETVRRGLQRQGLPLTHPSLRNTEAMLAAMRRDKKARDGRLAFSLLTHIGGCKLIEDVNESDICAVLSEG